jgi:hypothetical protein
VLQRIENCNTKFCSLKIFCNTELLQVLGRSLGIYRTDPTGLTQRSEPSAGTSEGQDATDGHSAGGTWSVHCASNRGSVEGCLKTKQTAEREREC